MPRLTIKPEVFVIVDGYWTGGYIAPGLSARGYDCIHIESDAEINGEYRTKFHESKYIKTLKYEGNLEEIVLALSSFKIKAVLPGIDTGVGLADMLADRLGLPNRNPIEMTAARRDKFAMIEALKDAGVPHAKYHYSDNVSELIQYAEKELNYPVVVKPVDSTEGNGVHFCRNKAEVKQAFESIVGAVNVLGATQSAAMVQEQLLGEQYVVNSISVAGKHHITDIWHLARQSNPRIAFKHAELLSRDHPLVEACQAYVSDVLSALKIQYGAAHTEVMLTDYGLKLIETSPRMEGDMDPASVEKALGYSQPSLLVESLVHPEQFARHFERLCGEYPRQHSTAVYFISPIAKEIKAPIDHEPFTRLPSFASMSSAFLPGEKLAITGLNKSPGYVYLVHPEKAQVDVDHQAVLAAEAKIYEHLAQPALDSVRRAAQAAQPSFLAGGAAGSVTAADKLSDVVHSQGV